MSTNIKKIIVTGIRSLLATDNDFFNISQIIYQIIVKQDSSLDFCIVLVSIQSIKIDIEIILEGDNSSCNIIFLYALAADQSIKVTTQQRHTGRQTKSLIVARGIVKDAVCVHHEGLISIASQAAQSDAVFKHTAIVLDGKAQVTFIPSIEVLNYDVQCSHGAAVGQFDQQHIWYLKSRGCDEIQTYHLLARSFFQEYIASFDQSEKILESLCQKII
ncbi:SufD family Fe-S cluster assembly protein [Candidatus Dependentiae bacterium]|nr:SufD family Fe-S cluster assembly protein [Candidatus Dependentiae bacterium]